ncbi:multidrug resistance protein, putative [Entamoeba invadens IP1]|uniref:Multidrug resistance protein, putative n=1 Tax=Entamoeba invadens IP1 TaxID=370355 RepID=A0A0A1UAL8_ENTIV|nr:multidrug resistance protein, putative [Entamoeba invadens IP1]ELP92097.1 multidrug resistance protein, putative [Entamoeba invadens IP1]|eukprot:XP_004258868.1 multidrug resistance protein, putative [Entamoeba invadens IP1]
MRDQMRSFQNVMSNGSINIQKQSDNDKIEKGGMNKLTGSKNNGTKSDFVMELDSKSYDQFEQFETFNVSEDPNFLITMKPIKEESGKIAILSMYKYANWFDYTLLLVGIVGAIGVGILQPLIMLLFGELVDTFDTQNLKGGFFDELIWKINIGVLNSLVDATFVLIKKMCYFAIANMVAGMLQNGCLFLLGQRQGMLLKRRYFRSLMKQDCGWHDIHMGGELSSHVMGEIQTVQDGLSVHVGGLFQIVAAFVTGFSLGFTKSWDLTLIILMVTPIMILCTLIIGFSSVFFTNQNAVFSAEANSLAEQTVGAARTVQALNQQNVFIAEFTKQTKRAEQKAALKSHAIGLSFGTIMLFMMLSLALSGWYGSLLMMGKGKTPNFTAGSFLVVFMSSLIATQRLATIALPLNIISSARSAAFKVYTTIERYPDIDENYGKVMKTIKGKIDFEDVRFSYPIRPLTMILDGLSFTAKEGETTAFVGESGCGKSTVVQLIQRMYEPTAGRILLDGELFTNLKTSWLRDQIGIVGQEPTLFSGTIFENISYGSKSGTFVNKEEVVKCCKKYGLDNFISALPDGYDTVVGERGAQLSGGQKQRIAIARALVRNPKILLLDEATSALDTESERVVQEALDRASEGRTTIIIAHRLSTIKNADVINVVVRGKIVEKGSHDELMTKKGIYYRMNEDQEIQSEENSENENEKEKDDAAILVKKEASTMFDDKESVERLLTQIKKERRRMKYSNVLAALRVIVDNFKHEWLMCVIGIIGSIGAGAIFPFYTLKFIDAYMCLMSITGTEMTETQKAIIKNTCCYFVILGVSAFVAYYLYNGLFLAAGEKMAGRVRRRLYRKIMYQDAGWFDRSENSVGSLVSRIISDTNTMKGIGGERIGSIAYMLSSVGFALGIAFYFDWRVSACVLAATPIFIISIVVNNVINIIQAIPYVKLQDKTNTLFVESVEAIKTLKSLNKTAYFSYKYVELVNKQKKQMYVWFPIITALAGLCHFIDFGINAYGWFIGITFMEKNISTQMGLTEFLIDVTQRFVAFQKGMMCVIFAAQAVATFGSLIPEMSRANAAGKRVYNTIDRKPKISCTADGIEPETMTGKIVLENVCFRYPTRPNISVLRGISTVIEPGQTVAFVGESGCGKSTIVQLIQRFYDPTYGIVKIDDNDVAEYQLGKLREKIGVVGQEPTLFAESIFNNIKKGIPFGETVNDEQIFAAAKMANAHDFISALPDGYDTVVGERGAQLSGGQKQRIAIARALVRNPKILLLDEATSALDTESERVVQEALDRASEGRTTIIIAHRLSTIKNADVINVVVRGKIVEKGSHDELMTKKGIYYSMVVNNP